MAQLSLGTRATPCGIALGSNLGNRIENLIRAAGEVLKRDPQARLTAAGGVYETAPVDCPEGSDPFLNTVIEIETDTGPHDLHRILCSIERDLGRAQVREKNAPRSIDLDILYIGDRVINEPDLIIPHPRLHQRRFVLQPLADIRPDRVIGTLRRTVADLLAALDDEPSAVKRVRREWISETL
jgi:2-amino-4-hydroxy-6-hydroxymethyldihydropteridine diphosphokinase